MHRAARLRRPCSTFSSELPANVNIFRLDLYPPLTFVRDDLRKAIEDARLQARFVRPGDPLS